MARSLHVSLLPDLAEDNTTGGQIAVIIDILRASSTITTALQNRAAEVIPCGTPEEAHRKRQQHPSARLLLGGERGGIRIEGFDFGNSPAEYDVDAVSGRTVVFTTTNGTKALLRWQSAAQILIGCFLNRKALVDYLMNDRRNIQLVCAGTDGSVTGEDVLFAGSVVDAILQRSVAEASSDTLFSLNDAARIAQAFWRQETANARIPADTHAESGISVAIESSMRASLGGRNLQSLGYASDIHLCSQTDVCDVIPSFEQERNRLVPLVPVASEA